MASNTEFMKGAFEALVERGILTADMLKSSKVTDEMIQSVEEEFDVAIPDEVREYLKAYSHSIRMLCAARPDGFIGDDPDIMHEINEMTPDEIAKMDEDEATYLSECWSEILPMPEDDPLDGLKDWISGFRASIALLHKFGFSEDRKTHYKKWGEETYFDAHYYKLSLE